MGNGQFITGDSITYIYNETGTQFPTVLLQTDDMHTCDKAFTDSLFIPTVTANFSTNGPLCLGESLIIDNLSVNTDTYEWNYGENNDTTLSLSNYIYTNPGNYTISLLAQKHFENGLICSDISEQEITIHPTPVSDFIFSIENQNDCVFPKKVDFTNNCIDATSYEWQFTNEYNKSNSSCETNPTHIYNVAGTFDIILICYNEFSCSDKSTQPITINPEIYANFDIPISSGCEPLTTTLTNTSFSNSENIEDPIISWDWDLGNGLHSNEENPISTFVHGSHNISLIIETENGCRDTITKDSSLLVYRTPTANFIVEENNNEINPESYGEIQFMNTSGGGTSPYQSYWDFDDGSMSNEVSPLHRYSSNTSYLGEAYQPELIISDANGCSDTIRQKISMDYFNGLFVPNAMAMDYGNGEQKVFMPKGKSLMKYHLTIYDRFGNKLFETSAINSEDGSPMEAWDGKTDGKKAEEGVYVWKINATFSDGSTWDYKTKTGKTTNTGTFLVLR
jgi:PKD repeat protein